MSLHRYRWHKPSWRDRKKRRQKKRRRHRQAKLIHQLVVKAGESL